MSKEVIVFKLLVNFSGPSVSDLNFSGPSVSDLDLKKEEMRLWPCIFALVLSKKDTGKQTSFEHLQNDVFF